MQELRQSSEIKVRIGSAVDAGDGVTPETSLALGTADQAELLKHDGAATSSIAANAFAAVTGSDGWYDLTLTTGNTDTLGQLTVVVQDSSLMAPIFRDFMVVTANYWDSKYSTDNLQVDLVQWLGAAAATPTVAGVPEVDVTHLAGGVQTVTDLKDFADAGYDPATNQIEGVKLADTTTMNTDMVAAAPTVTQIRQEMDDHSTALNAILTDTEFTIPGTLSDIQGATFVTGTDSLESIRDRGDAAWVTAAGFSTAAALTTHDGKLDTVDGIVDAIVVDTAEIGTAGAGLTDLGGMSTNMKGDVNSEVSDVMTVDTMSEPPQGPPPSTPTFEQMFAYMYFRMMNKNEETATEHSVYDVAGTTKVIKADVSDSAGVLTKSAFISGA